MKKSLLLMLTFGIFLFGCAEGNVPISSSSHPPLETKNNPVWVEDLKNSYNHRPDMGARCTYNNQVVYYMISECCDKFNYLYSEDHQIICAPDGGFTGKGDGKCEDFSFGKNKCKVIWSERK